MSFRSILFENADLGAGDDAHEPEFFTDLHLDQVVASLTAGREDYQLEPFFYQPLPDVEAVGYRHGVLRDLEQSAVREAVNEFAQGMRLTRERLGLADTLHYARQKQRWFVDAVAAYCSAITTLAERLVEQELGSRGFRELRGYVTDYAQGDYFTSLAAEAEARADELSQVRYAVHIKGNRVRVSHYNGEPDMSQDVKRTFAKFSRGVLDDHRVRFAKRAEMNHVEAQILELVAELHPEPFTRLEDFCRRRERFADDPIVRFDREVQFYLAYLEYIEPLKESGLAFSRPQVSDRFKEERASRTFDLALAQKLRRDGQPLVCNNFELTRRERILVVSGPNNGGKTTFARTFGQLHVLASLGLPVPGSGVKLFLPDRVFTHFEREEDIATLRGKLEDELFRLHAILAQATGDSVLILNESFGSTTLRDARVVGTEVMRRIIDLDLLAVFVTFVDELASLGESTVSMMSTVVPEDPAVRTYRVVRKPADGLAYAAAIAEKYGLSYESLRRTIAA